VVGGIPDINAAPEESQDNPNLAEGAHKTRLMIALCQRWRNEQPDKKITYLQQVWSSTVLTPVLAVVILN
jgi:hypothetical protein